MRDKEGYMNKATKKLTLGCLMAIYKHLGIVTELDDGQIIGFSREKKKDAKSA